MLWSLGSSAPAIRAL